MAVDALEGRAFALMLKVQRELTKNMLTYGDGRYTIREVSEDNATIVLDRALRVAERRGARVALKLQRAATVNQRRRKKFLDR